MSAAPQTIPSAPQVFTATPAPAALFADNNPARVFATGSPDAFDIGAPVFNQAPAAFVPVSFAPSPAPFLPSPRSSFLPSRGGGFLSFLNQSLPFLNSAGGIGLSFFAESNRSRETLRGLRASETVALSRQGFTTGRATFDTNLLAQAAPVAIGAGGAGLGLGSLTPFLPLMVGGALLMMVMRR